MIYDLVENHGLLPITLGMSETDLIQIAGDGKLGRTRRPTKDVRFFLDMDLRVSLRAGRIVELSVRPPSQVLFEGKSLFEDETSWRVLTSRESDPRESNGFIVLRALGIAFTGLHDDNEAQRAITVFEKGRWDDLCARSKAFEA